MPTLIDIPNVGQIEFPDSMSEGEINDAASKLYRESSAKTEEPPGMFQTLATEAASSVVPGLAAAALGKGGAVLATPGGPVAQFAGGAVGALAGGLAGSAAQEKVLEVVAPEFASRLETLRQQGQEAHPVAAGIGRFLGSLGAWQLAPGQTLRGVAALPAIARGTATEAEKAAANVAAVQIGAGTAAGAAVPLVLQQRLPTGGELIEAAGQAALLGQPRIPSLRIGGAPAVTRTTTPEVPSAIQEQPAAEVLRTVPEQPVQGERQVPAQEGAGRVSPGDVQPQEAQARQVPLTPEQQAEAVQELEALGGMFGEAKAGGGDVTPAGASRLQKLIEFFRPPPEVPPTALAVDTTSILPDFDPNKANANAVFSQPFAAEKIPILGRLLGGKARIRNEQDQALATWFAEKDGVRPANASVFGEQIRGKINSAFDVNETGDITNIQSTRPGQSIKKGDVFEELQRNPNAYVLSPQQRAAVNLMTRIRERANALRQKYNISGEELGDENVDTGPYFTRIVTARPPGREGALRGAGSGRVGAKPFFEKERAFETEKEGWDKGYKYENNIEKILVTYVDRLYRAIADKRLATDPALGGKTRPEKLAELREAYAEELGTGKMTEEKLNRIVDGLQNVGTVYQPAFFGKIFDAPTANLLNREFGAEQASLRRTLANTNDFLKALQLGFDLGVGQIQLLPTLFRNPLVWGQANGRALAAMVNPKHFSQYVNNNLQAVQELAQHGSSIGRLPEMLSGMTGGTIERVPGLREAAKPFARQFQTALDVAKIELWKARRQLIPQEQWPEAIRALESQLLTGRMESAMVPHSRALLERVLLLAPSYYRGALDQIALLGQGGVSGDMARKSMGAFILGSLALYTGVGAALGMDEKEIMARLNPTRPDFMLWPVELGGKKVNIGLGGIFRSFLRLAGNVARTSVDEPENWDSLAPDKNPFTRWYRGHAGPAVSLAWDAFSGKDFLGEKTTVSKMAGRTLLPLWLQPIIGRQQGAPRPTATETIAQAVGLNVLPDRGAQGEVAGLLRNWATGSDDPKVKQFWQSRKESEFSQLYGPLRRALSGNDLDRARAEYEKLLPIRKHSEIADAMRARTGAGFKPIAGMSRAMEMQFRRTLTPEQEAVFQAARQERAQLFQRFQEMLQETK